MKRFELRAAVLAVVLTFGGMSADAADQIAQAGGAIETRDAHARIMPSAKVGAVYLHIANTGNEPDRLVAAATPIARTAELHSMTDDKGVMKMRPVEGGIEIKPGGTLELKPGGLHIMLMGVTTDLKPGDKFDLDLAFLKAGTRRVAVTIDPPSGHGH